MEHRPLGVDLRHDWPAALLAAGFDAGQPTAWIAEGLLIYLPSQAQDALFDNILDLSAAGSRVGTEDVASISDEQLGEMSAGMRAIRDEWPDPGPDVDIAELLYAGERAEASEYLRRKGRSTEGRSTSELFGTYGLVLPDSSLTPFGDPVYVTATLTGPVDQRGVGAGLNVGV